LCLSVVYERLDPNAFDGLGQALASVDPAQWIMAAVATVISFGALGWYDVVAHRHFRTGLPPWQAAISGAVAIALAQTIGFGALTGALARWRMLPTLNMLTAAKITFGVAISFLMALAPILGLMLWITGNAYALPWAPVLLALPLGTSLLLLTRRFFTGVFRLPSLPAQARIALLALVDTIAAAAALYVFLPAECPPFLMVYSAYLMALALALLTGAPGGLGAFELTLLTALPQVPDSALLVAIIAFRLMYYVVPAICAIIALARPLQSPRAPEATGPVRRELLQNGRAELAVCQQNEARAVKHGGATLAVVETPHTATALFDPLNGRLGDALPGLHNHAKARNLMPLIYKCQARSAVEARKAGWHAVYIADEMVLNPATFHTEGSAFRQLRRKLRQASAAGVWCSDTQMPSVTVLRSIDAAWRARNGRARGVSMGRFCPEYIFTQRLYTAYVGKRAVAFATFHHNTDELCLDLMRALPDAPQGAMHALLYAAITDAATEGRRRLSLAALPRQANESLSWPERKLLAFNQSAQGQGLSQFKTCFCPHREPLYAAAPNRLVLLLALSDLARAIRHPVSNTTQHYHEEIQFADALQT